MNRSFTDVVAEAAPQGAVVPVQDDQLPLVAGSLVAHGPSLPARASSWGTGRIASGNPRAGDVGRRVTRKPLRTQAGRPSSTPQSDGHRQRVARWENSSGRSMMPNARSGTTSNEAFEVRNSATAGCSISISSPYFPT